MGLTYYAVMRQTEDAGLAKRERKQSYLARKYKGLAESIGEPVQGLEEQAIHHDQRALYFQPTAGHA